jgi:hypothetical protein
MRIRIAARVPMPEIPSEVELEGGSLRDLFADVFGSTYFAKEIMDLKTGDMLPDGVFDVTLNGVPYHSLAQGLDTALQDGDVVSISLVMLGGG